MTTTTRTAKINESHALERIRCPEVKRRFAKKLLIVGPDSVPGCWLWTGHVTSKGYGQFHYGDRAHWAHRIAYAIYKGCIPAGKTVHHRFTPEGHGSPLLHDCNPDNLELMDMRENIGESNGRGGYRGRVKATMLRCATSGNIETFRCPRCAGTAVRTEKRYICLNCDRDFALDEVIEEAVA